MQLHSDYSGRKGNGAGKRLEYQEGDGKEAQTGKGDSRGTFPLPKTPCQEGAARWDRDLLPRNKGWDGRDGLNWARIGHEEEFPHGEGGWALERDGSLSLEVSRECLALRALMGIGHSLDSVLQFSPK